MKISSINSYSYASFGVRKNGKYAGKHANKSNTNPAKTVATVGGIGLAGATILGSALLIPACNNNSKPDIEATSPNSAYVETTEVPSYDDIISETINSNQNNKTKTEKISAIPQSEREAVWYEVKKGDRLADIVKEYAELHELTPDSELVPYYEILEQDNPGKWEDRNNIWVGIRFRVDGIMPENRITTVQETEETSPAESHIAESQPVEEQVTTEKDKVLINGNTFTFDADTMDKTFFGDYEGLMFGKFASIDVKMNGGMILKKYEGVTDKTNLSQKIEYDKDGKITEIVDYKDDKAVKVSSYSYKMDSTVETVKDKMASGQQIDEIITEYDNREDVVNSRQFLVNGKTVANFDFQNNIATIGIDIWNLEEFKCNDDIIGSGKYIGSINGKDVRFDSLKNGFCVEYLGSNGEIAVREQFDSNGTLIYTE